MLQMDVIALKLEKNHSTITPNGTINYVSTDDEKNYSGTEFDNLYFKTKLCFINLWVIKISIYVCEKKLLSWLLNRH